MIDKRFYSGGLSWGGETSYRYLLSVRGGAGMTFVKGDSYGAGRCRIFPLAFSIVGVGPIEPAITIEDKVGRRKVATSILAHHLSHGCMALEGRLPVRAPKSHEVGACNLPDFVVEWSGSGGKAIRPVRPALETAAKAAEQGAGTMAVKLTRTQSKSGKYYTFAIPGVRGQVHIAPKMVSGEVPNEIEVVGVTFVEPNADVVAGDEEKAAKAAEKAKKAQEKAEKAQAKAAERAAKAQAAVEKAQARAAAALAKAQGGTPAEGSTEGAVEQPNL